MEIPLLILLFLVGTVVGALQALKFLERRNRGRARGRDDTDADETPPNP